jgi:hypothetical protein
VQDEAQEAEPAAATTTEPTDRADPPPPHQQQEQAEDRHQGSGATPGATAGSSQQDAPHLEQVVENGGGERPRQKQKEQDRPAASCDLYRGRWVYDVARAPLYKEHECGFLTEQVTCMRNGRRDDAYQKWRWQPDGCDILRCARPTDPLLIPCFACTTSFLAALRFALSPHFLLPGTALYAYYVHAQACGSGLVRGLLSRRFPFSSSRNRRIVSVSWVAQISRSLFPPLAPSVDVVIRPTCVVCRMRNNVREDSLQASLTVCFLESGPTATV